MASGATDFQTRELSPETWPDFEELFSRGNGWDFCWCTAFHRIPRRPRRQFRTRAEVSVVNHEDKKLLVYQGQAHGILVYAEGEPVGWCQYGRTSELRRPQAPDSGEEDLDSTANVWRLTCFTVDKRYRRRGVAGVALRAALEAIREQGGGIVEAFPVACWTHGPEGTDEVSYVQGVGPLAPAWGGFNNVSFTGVASMLEKEGFEAVEVIPGTERRSPRVRQLGAQGYRVLMRKTV